jgi:hypothetical protein
MTEKGIEYILPPTGDDEIIPGGLLSDGVSHDLEGNIRVDSGYLNFKGKDLGDLTTQFKAFSVSVQLAEQIVREGVPGSNYMTKKRTFEEWKEIFPEQKGKVSHFNGERGVEIDLPGGTVYAHDNESLKEVFGRIRNQKEGLDTLRDFVSSSARNHELGKE